MFHTLLVKKVRTKVWQYIYIHLISKFSTEFPLNFYIPISLRLYCTVCTALHNVLSFAKTVLENTMWFFTTTQSNNTLHVLCVDWFSYGLCQDLPIGVKGHNRDYTRAESDTLKAIPRVFFVCKQVLAQRDMFKGNFTVKSQIEHNVW